MSEHLADMDDGHLCVPADGHAANYKIYFELDCQAAEDRAEIISANFVPLAVSQIPRS